MLMICDVAFFTTNKVPLRYSNHIPEITLAYETYGELNPAKDNALLVIHGFSSGSHVAAHNTADVTGWWEWAVGPGKPLDTNRYFIVCANNFGGCFGSTGPVFPPPAIADIVFCQQQLQAELGIDRWYAVIGGSLGGMAVLEWLVSYPEKIQRAVCLNAGAKLSFIGQGLLDIQEEIIRAMPDNGLKLARRLANLSYVGEEFFTYQQSTNPDWQLGCFLKAEEDMFASGFNCDSYLGFLQAMRRYELKLRNSPLAACSFKPSVFLAGCVEDILFPVGIIEETNLQLGPFAAINKIIVNSKYGHDAFLMDELLYSRILRSFLS
ncbi:Homoserine O-succinyltransferase [Sporomusa termitida]|uniref:Homoserine O-acetyltransferase n=1 Tax=Sporomusa termitida TaxID=2377 RepID=A0A517DWH7_9FIRM|nr:Homoserine O-succinyltransferase [Sporomusa termitida]